MILEKEMLPEIFNELDLKVKKLYAEGNLNLLEKPSVTIVGTREPTAYGRHFTREIVEKLIKHDIVIVSGLARGVDYEAHLACLKAGGESIGVLGCGLDIHYPKHKYELKKHYINQLLFLTEYDVGVKPMSYHFPKRNRILSALSDVVIVIEATRKSGTMITAHFAIEQGKDLFALPGRLSDPLSEGPNYLISMGAYPIIDVDLLIEDILRRNNG